jgi:hypothetical protein
MISWVDASLKTYDRPVLMVEGRPFFYNGIQIRVDKLRDVYGYTDGQIKNCFVRAGKDGFTVAGAQILWQDIQPDIFFNAAKSGNSPDGMFADFDLPSPDQRGTWSAAKLRVYANCAANADRKLNLYGRGIGGELCDLGTMPAWDPADKVHYYDFDVTEFVNIRYRENKKASFVFKPGAEAGRSPELIISRKDVFDWTWVDKILYWAEDADIKLEILWFGSDTCSVSIDRRVPFYVFHDCQNALKRDGSPFFEKCPADDIMGVYWYLLCKNDPLLREYEHKALNALFNHIAEYARGRKKTVIGCQVSNEPAVGKLHGSGIYADDRCYCKNCNKKIGSGDLQEFKDRTMWEFNNNLAEAVKQSAYPVWTRCNNYNGTDAPGVAYNEKMRCGDGTSLDFIGFDPYSDDPAVLFAYGHGVNPLDNIDYSQGRNLPMVMENGGEYSNSAKLALASLAGGAFYTVYDFCGPDGHGLYDDTEKTGAPVPHGIYIAEVRHINSMLNRIAYILAAKKSDGAGGSSLLFFNPLSAAKTNETKNLGSMEIRYESFGGVGIACFDEAVDEKGIVDLVLLSTKEAVFTVKGHNTGSSESTKIRVGAFGCVRIIIEE